MSHSEPDYKLLYEQSQQELARAGQQLAQMEAQADKQIATLEQKLSHSEQQLSLTEQKLQLALLEINELRAKLFGSKSDQRVKKAAGKEVDILPLDATPAEVATSEALIKGEVEQERQKTAETKAKAATTRMHYPYGAAFASGAGRSYH